MARDLRVWMAFSLFRLALPRFFLLGLFLYVSGLDAVHHFHHLLGCLGEAVGYSLHKVVFAERALKISQFGVLTEAAAQDARQHLGLALSAEW